MKTAFWLQHELTCRTWQEFQILYLGAQTELFCLFTFHLDLGSEHSTASCFFTSVVLPFAILQNKTHCIIQTKTK